MHGKHERTFVFFVIFPGRYARIRESWTGGIAVKLRFVLGRAGTGKTRHCLDEVRARLAEAPDGPPLILLVPEQATFTTEYALLGTPGVPGTMRAQALSFRRLAFRVMQETGGTALVPIGENGKNMLLFKLLHRHADRLRLFAGSAGQRGFVDKLNELLTEMKRYGVTPESLETLAADAALASPDGLLERKLHDIRLLYAELESALAGRYLDAEDGLAYLARGFGASSLAAAEIWVDGFHGFTPAEYAALETMIRCARSVTVTLTLDRPYGPGEQPPELDLFRPTAETYIRLRELAERSDVPVEPPFVLRPEPAPRWADSPMLAHLERHYGSRTPMAVPEDWFDPEHPRCGVVIRAAANRRAEVDAAARDILRRVQEDGLRWRDIAVMVRNLADYADLIEKTFSDYGIPFFLDRKSVIPHHPLVEFIRSALETVTGGWRHDAVIRCIKTELLTGPDSGIDRSDLDRLENYVLAAGIDGRRWLDPGSWRPLVRDPLEDEPGPAEEEDPDAFRRLLQCRERIVAPLDRFGRALARARDVRAMCAALYDLLDAVGAADRLEAWSLEDAENGELLRSRAHRQLWDGVMSLLDQLVELAGEERMPADLFAGMVETGLDSLQLGSVPPSVDQVLVGSLDRSRTGGVLAGYLLGANEGVLPMRSREDGVLTERERERLEDGGIRMAPGARRRLLDERFLIYGVLTMPSRTLWISFAMADEEGKALYPSELIRQVRTQFPKLPVLTETGEPDADGGAEEHLRHIRRPDRALSLLVGQLRRFKESGRLPDLWRDVYNWFAERPEWRDRLAAVVSSLRYRNEAPPLLPVTALRLYGDRLLASVSRMERFTACPFQHFAAYGLKLEERRLFRLEAPDVGQLFHAALSRLADTYGGRLGEATREEIAKTVSDIVDSLVPRLQSRILMSSSRYGFIARRLKQTITRTAAALAEHARRGLFAPVGLEIAFGPGGKLPPLVLPAGSGRSVEVIGRIDRVDAAETEDGLLLRIIDYKSSAQALRLEDVVFGLTLQLLTYMDALLTHAPAWLGKPADPAGVLYFHVHDPLISAYAPLPGEEVRRQTLRRYKTRGLLSADERIIRMMDRELETGRSDLVPAGLKKDGGFYSDSAVVTREEWNVLRGAVRRTIERIGSRILDGEVAIAPYRQGNRTPCAFCPYKPVCHFDPLIEGNGYKRIARIPKERIWDLLREGTDAEKAPVGPSVSDGAAAGGGLAGGGGNGVVESGGEG
jgi:ATP-dependent helicase/nuclease subunit B